MKKNKSNLDEMQEKQLLKIEHNACWIAFWGLLAAIYIQTAVGNGGIERLGGEIVIMLILSVYICVSCIKNGIWDRKLKPNFKTNLVASLITGLGLGIFWALVSYHRYHAPAGSLAAGVFMFLFTAGSVLLLLSLTAAAYNHRKKKLEDEPDDDENEIEENK